MCSTWWAASAQWLPSSDTWREQGTTVWSSRQYTCPLDSRKQLDWELRITPLFFTNSTVPHNAATCSLWSRGVNITKKREPDLFFARVTDTTWGVISPLYGNNCTARIIDEPPERRRLNDEYKRRRLDRCAKVNKEAPITWWRERWSEWRNSSFASMIVPSTEMRTALPGKEWKRVWNSCCSNVEGIEMRGKSWFLRLIRCFSWIRKKSISDWIFRNSWTAWISTTNLFLRTEIPLSYG